MSRICILCSSLHTSNNFCIRMEKLGLKTWPGKAKILGAILCVGGALTTSLYKGMEFHICNNHSHQPHTNSGQPPKTHMLQGTLFLVASCMSYTAWYIVQVKLLKALPLKYWATMLSCIIASVQAVVVGLCLDRTKASWALGWNLELVTIVYSGALATAATFCLVSWAISLKGPTYPPMFHPLSLIFVAFSESIFLGETVKVGMLIGMVLIISVLYSFLWGNRKETPNVPPPTIAAAKVPTVMAIEGAGLQSTAIIAPNSSPHSTVIDVEKIDTTEKFPLTKD